MGAMTKNPLYMIRTDRTNVTNTAHAEYIKAIQQACAEILSEMRQNWRIKHPTKAESILQLFCERAGEQIDFDELSSYYENTRDADEAAWMAINRLNAKLEKKGFRIERPRAYEIVPVEPQPK
jgi:hypothetical protein